MGLFPEIFFHIYNWHLKPGQFYASFFAYVQAGIFHTSAFFGAKFDMDQILSNLAAD